MEVFDVFSDFYKRGNQEELSLQDFLMGCREDPTMHATAAERMISAVGEPEIIDTLIDQCQCSLWPDIHLDGSTDVRPQTAATRSWQRRK